MNIFAKFKYWGFKSTFLQGLGFGTGLKLKYLKLVQGWSTWLKYLKLVQGWCIWSWCMGLKYLKLVQCWSVWSWATRLKSANFQGETIHGGKNKVEGGGWKKKKKKKKWKKKKQTKKTKIIQRVKSLNSISINFQFSISSAIFECRMTIFSSRYPSVLSTGTYKHSKSFPLFFSIDCENVFKAFIVWFLACTLHHYDVFKTDVVFVDNDYDVDDDNDVCNIDAHDDVDASGEIQFYDGVV